MLSSIPDPRAKTIPFTLTVRLDEEYWEGLELDCAGEADAIAAAREVLQAKVDDRPPMACAARRGLVGVGIGSMLDTPGQVVWLGEWEWNDLDGWIWTASD